MLPGTTSPVRPAEWRRLSEMPHASLLSLADPWSQASRPGNSGRGLLSHSLASTPLANAPRIARGRRALPSPGPRGTGAVVASCLRDSDPGRASALQAARRGTDARGYRDSRRVREAGLSKAGLRGASCWDRAGRSEASFGIAASGLACLVTCWRWIRDGRVRGGRGFGR
jgi:hypothetical protein